MATAELQREKNSCSLVRRDVATVRNDTAPCHRRRHWAVTVARRSVTRDANVPYVSRCRRMSTTTRRLGRRRRQRLCRHWQLRRAARLTHVVVQQLLDVVLARAQSRLQSTALFVSQSPP